VGVKALLLAFGAGVVLLVAAGCGGSSSSADWEVVEQTQVSGPEQAGFLHAKVGRPSDVELKVEANPKVKIRTHYTVICGTHIEDDAEGKRNRDGASGETPLTTAVVLPEGEPSTCIITAVAEKSAPADMTVTLLTRPTAA
jgi:hypothetical protein